MEKRVKGNYLSFVLPITRTVVNATGVTKENYYPANDDKIVVRFVGFNTAEFKNPTVNGYKLLFEDNGTLPVGIYAVELLITKADGKLIRGFDKAQLQIVESNDEANDEATLTAESTRLKSNILSYTTQSGETIDGLTANEVRQIIASYNFATQAQIPDTSDFVTTDTLETELAKKADSTSIPNVSGFAAKSYVDEELAKKADSDDIPDTTGFAKSSDMTTELAKKVDKVSGKGLSTNDFTTALKQKLESLENYDDTSLDGRVDNLEKVDYTSFLTKTEASQTYQTKGNYLTQHQSLSDYLKSADASTLYQPKGTYLTAHQDISEKADKEQVVDMTEETATLSPNKFYRWGVVSSLDLSLAEPTDATHTNAYHFRFTAGDSTMLAVPADVIWQNNVEPTRTSGNTYEISILDNCASFMEFQPYDD